MPAPAAVPQPSTTRQRGRRRQGQMRAPFFRAEAPACLPAPPPACMPCHRAPARPTSAGGQRPRACHALRSSSGGSAAPLERARDEQEQEAGPLRLTSARVATAHDRAGTVGRSISEHFFFMQAPIACAVISLFGEADLAGGC
jgi:hypothetical protein